MSAAPYLTGFDWVKIRDEFSLGLHHKSVIFVLRVLRIETVSGSTPILRTHD
ncbi:hypothetical protein [Nitrospira sp. Nam80]